MKKSILSVFFVLLIPALSFSQGDKQFKKSLKQLFEVSGTQEAYKAAIQQMMVVFRAQKSDVPKEVWDDFENEFLNTSLDDLVEMLTPVYEKYLTKGDLEEIIKFYSTPTGKKYASSTPLITKESMEIGQEWGAKIGEKFVKKLKEKGY